MPRAFKDAEKYYIRFAAWRANAVQDAVAPTVEGYFVLASTAVHERRHFKDEWIVEQYSGPDLGPVKNSLMTQMTDFPRVIIVGGIGPLYDGLAEGAVVHPIPDIAGSVPPHMLTLCPRVANELGWHPDRRHVFTYLDADGEVIVKTLYWRDGGVRTDDTDSAVRSYGFLLVVREESVMELAPHMATAQVSRAWRATQKVGEEDRIAVSAERHNTS